MKKDQLREMLRKRFANNFSGFTLIEILVAIAIMGFIMVLVQGTSKQMFDAKKSTEDRDILFQTGRVVLRKISDDVTEAFLLKTTSSVDNGAVAPLATPVIRSVPKVVTFFIGEDGGDQDRIRFTSMSHLRLKKNAKESDQCKISYRLVPSETSGFFQLMRSEEANLDERTDLAAKEEMLADHMKELNFEYYDPKKEEWVREWNTETIDAKDRLPSAVRIIAAFGDAQNEDEKIVLETATLLPLSNAPIDF